MKKGFTLIEVVAAAALLLIITTALTSLNSISIMTDNRTFQKDEQFNIARSVCEKFKCEDGNVSEKSIVLYVNSILDIPGNITNALAMEPNALYIDSEEIKKYGNNKRFAVLLQCSKSQGVNVLMVTVISMNKILDELSLKVTRKMEI